MSASKNKKPVVERLFYTFGSIFLAAMVVVCGINFKKDARAVQSAFLPPASAASANQGATGTAKASNSSTDAKGSTSKTATKSSTKTSAGTSSMTSSAASSSTAASASSDSKSTATQQTVVAEP